MSTGHGPAHPRWCRVQTVVVHVDWSWLNYEALHVSAELKQSLFWVIFPAIFVRKNKIHWKYVHIFRLKNKRPKNEKAFFGAENKKEKEIRSVSSLYSHPLDFNGKFYCFHFDTILASFSRNAARKKAVKTSRASWAALISTIISSHVGSSWSCKTMDTGLVHQWYANLLPAFAGSH